MRRLFVLALMLLAACTAGAPGDSDNRTADHSGIVVSAQTDRTIAALDETIRFTLSVTCPQHVQLHMPEIGSLIAGLRIVYLGEIGPRQIDNRFVFEKWFDLRADLRGAYIIPAMTVRAVDHDETREITTPQIFIKVGAHSVRADNETIQDIIDIKPPAALPRDLRFFILVGVIVFVLFLVGLAAWLYMRRSRAASLVPQKPAHVLAYEQLEQLERERLVEKGIVHTHYVRLSDIFRQYLQNRFAIPAVEQTTQELLPVKKIRVIFCCRPTWSNLPNTARRNKILSPISSRSVTLLIKPGLTLGPLSNRQPQTACMGEGGNDPF